MSLFIGVRDQFCLGGGGGWVQMSKYFIHCLPENQVVLPKYYMIFARKYYLKILGAAAPASYAYVTINV